MDVGGTLGFAAVPISLVLVGHVSKLECDSSPREVLFCCAAILMKTYAHGIYLFGPADLERQWC